MTDPSRIRALIAKIEAGHVGREESDEYLVLCCGWVHEEMYGDGGIGPFSIIANPADDKAYYADRPHPLANAQDALDSLPEGTGWDAAGTIGKGNQRIRLMIGARISAGMAKTPAAAICLANLRRKLAELEGG